jgi:hypothetical protein
MATIAYFSKFGEFCFWGIGLQVRENENLLEFSSNEDSPYRRWLPALWAPEQLDGTPVLLPEGHDPHLGRTTLGHPVQGKNKIKLNITIEHGQS